MLVKDCVEYLHAENHMRGSNRPIMSIREYSPAPNSQALKHRQKQVLKEVLHGMEPDATVTRGTRRDWLLLIP
jgi:hypothetical protein